MVLLIDISTYWPLLMSVINYGYNCCANNDLMMKKAKFSFPKSCYVKMFSHTGFMCDRNGHALQPFDRTISKMHNP